MRPGIPDQIIEINSAWANLRFAFSRPLLIRLLKERYCGCTTQDDKGFLS
jgi:hypothetical protein